MIPYSVIRIKSHFWGDLGCIQIPFLGLLKCFVDDSTNFLLNCYKFDCFLDRNNLIFYHQLRSIGYGEGLMT